MIDGYYFQKMHINEKGNFASEVVGVSISFKASSPALAAHLLETETRLATFKKTLEKLSLVDISALMEADDNERDGGLVNLRDYAQVCASRSNAEWSQAGQKIVNTFKKVGWQMNEAPYGDETNRVDSFLNMLKTEPELQQAVTTIMGQDWVAEIESGQAKFKQHSAIRIDKNAVEEAKSNTSLAARELGIALDRMLRFIESEIEFYGKVELKTLVIKINEIISTYVVLQKQRATRALNAKDNKMGKP